MTRLDALPGAEERLCVVCGHTDIVSAGVYVFRGVVGIAFHCHRDACREDVTAHSYLDVTDHARTLGLLPKEGASTIEAHAERERRVLELIDTIAGEYPDRSGVIQSIVARLREALDPTTPDRK